MTNPAGSLSRPPRRISERTLTLTILVLAAAAWVTIAFTHGTSLDHHALGAILPDTGAGHDAAGHGTHTGGSELYAVMLLVLSGWFLMIVAMMLPPALPLVQTMRNLTAQQRQGLSLLALGVGAFLAVWAAVGVLMLGGDAALHAIVQQRSWADQAAPFITGGVLAAAGLYQFSPLKRACLRACRSPRSFALAHWSGRRSPAVEMLTLSSSYAVSCVGCCWALMAVSLAVGAAALPVMVMLTVIMAAERLVPWGRRLVVPAGFALLLFGVLTALRALPVATT